MQYACLPACRPKAVVVWEMDANVPLGGRLIASTCYTGTTMGTYVHIGAGCPTSYDGFGCTIGAYANCGSQAYAQVNGWSQRSAYIFVAPSSVSYIGSSFILNVQYVIPSPSQTPSQVSIYLSACLLALVITIPSRHPPWQVPKTPTACSSCVLQSSCEKPCSCLVTSSNAPICSFVCLFLSLVNLPSPADPQLHLHWQPDRWRAAQCVRHRDPQLLRHQHAHAKRRLHRGP